MTGGIQTPSTALREKNPSFPGAFPPPGCTGAAHGELITALPILQLPRILEALHPHDVLGIDFLGLIVRQIRPRSMRDLTLIGT